MTADEIAKLFDELQRRLDGPARYLFDLTIRQVFIDAVLMLVFGGLLAGVGCLCLFGARKAWLRHQESLYSSGDIVAALLVACAVLAGLIAAVLVFSALGNLLNPEYAAVQRILKMLLP